MQWPRRRWPRARAGGSGSAGCAAPSPTRWPALPPSRQAPEAWRAKRRKRRCRASEPRRAEPAGLRPSSRAVRSSRKQARSSGVATRRRRARLVCPVVCPVLCRRACDQSEPPNARRGLCDAHEPPTCRRHDGGHIVCCAVAAGPALCAGRLVLVGERQVRTMICKALPVRGFLRVRVSRSLANAATRHSSRDAQAAHCADVPQDDRHRRESQCRDVLRSCVHSMLSLG